eukprot:scaffold2193_cov74-Phaeocystis_antarctica.AAC.3
MVWERWHVGVGKVARWPTCWPTCEGHATGCTQRPTGDLVVLASKNDSSCTTASGIGTWSQATVVIDGIVGMTSMVGIVGIVGMKP